MEINETFDTENPQFCNVAKLVEHTNKFIYLTGKAGTGKTTLLSHIKNTTRKKTVVLAPTGIAAYNCDGVTIHSFFELPLIPIAPYDFEIKDTPAWTDRRDFLAPITSKYKPPKKKLLKKIELLIIDEVSMVSADILDAIDTILRAVRNNPNEVFGGVQVLLIGDAFQLMPVCPKRDWDELRYYYESGYFFSSIVVTQNPPVYIELKKIYRQNDEEFINLLDRIRMNILTNDDFEVLNSRYHQNSVFNTNEAILISTHNEKVNTTNLYYLNTLDSPQSTFKPIINGKFPESFYPLDHELCLKNGARVMFIKNDVGKTRRFYNGKLGVVKEITEDKISVCCDDGKIVSVKRAKWENYKYVLDEHNNIIREVVGTYEQFPLRLAWVITVHKSQGLTFKEIHVDLNDSFDNGQVYVGLSRCTSLEGVSLLSRVNHKAIKTAEIVLEFSGNAKPYDVTEFEYTLPEKSSLLQWLVKVENFKKHVESLDDQPEKIIKPSEQEFNQNEFCKQEVNKSKRLSLICSMHGRGSLNMKSRHTNFVKSWLIRNDLLCFFTIKELYSEHNNNYNEKVKDSMMKLERDILLRNKYLMALKEIRSCVDVLSAIDQQFKNDIENHYFVKDDDAMYPSSAIDQYLNKMLPQDITKNPIPLCSYYSSELNVVDEEYISKSISDEELKRIWLISDEMELSLANLKRLSKLIVMAYKKCYAHEISSARRERKRKMDREEKQQKYEAKKKYSKSEKLNCIKSNLQKKTSELATELGCTERNIRALKREIGAKSTEKNLAENIL